MMKKIVSLALAMVCASNLVLATVSQEETTNAMLAGQDYAAKMLQDGKTAQLVTELDAVANGVATPSLENSSKSIWFCAGAASVLALAGIVYGSYKGINFLKARNDAKKEEAKKNAAKKDDAKKEEVKEGEAKKEEAKEGEAKKEEAKEGEAKKEEAKEGEAKKEEAKEGEAKEDASEASEDVADDASEVATK